MVCAVKTETECSTMEVFSVFMFNCGTSCVIKRFLHMAAAWRSLQAAKTGKNCQHSAWVKPFSRTFHISVLNSDKRRRINQNCF